MAEVPVEVEEVTDQGEGTKHETTVNQEERSKRKQQNTNSNM